MIKLEEFAFCINSDLVTTTSPNYRPPSWPPPRDWPVVIDKSGKVVCRYGDSSWDLSPWAGKPITLNFGDGDPDKKSAAGSRAVRLDAENADLMRLIATWLIWGTQATLVVSTVVSYFNVLRGIVAHCSRNGIHATKLMRFPKVFEQLHCVIGGCSYGAVIVLLNRLYDARDVLGFTIVDPEGLKRLVAASPDREGVQTPYIPPRIWLYEVTRLRECLMDFLEHREKIEACFQFCLDLYVNKFGSLEAALEGRGQGGPFHSRFSNDKDYPGTFSDVATRFGISGVIAKWLEYYENTPDANAFSHYFTVVTFAGLAYICNFTLQRKQEVAALRASCLLWEDDEELGRVPIICGETTKTDVDSDARWIASPSVEIAIHVLSTIARLRMTCECAQPDSSPTPVDQNDPYLASRSSEPWGRISRRPYHIRSITKCFRVIPDGVGRMLFDPEQLRITADDLAVALRLTPNLPVEEFAVGKIWPLAWHQLRRTGCVNMFASGEISDSTMQYQMKHSTRLMSLYYGRNHGKLLLNKDVQVAVVTAMYQAQAEMAKVAATDDRFISPLAPERKEALAVNVLSATDSKKLIEMAKKGVIAFREHRLGGCMKAGVCEYGGIESVARCAGGDGAKPCTDVLYDREKESQVRADMLRLETEIKMLPPEHPRTIALTQEHRSMENYLNVVSTR